MTKSTLWRTLFLAVTGLAIGMEVWASWDGDDATDPWTALIVRHVPGEVTALAIAGLTGWLAVHFGLRYWRKHKAAKPVVGQSPITGKGGSDGEDE